MKAILTLDLEQTLERHRGFFLEYFEAKITGAKLAFLIEEDVTTTQRLIAGLVSAAVQGKLGCSSRIEP